MTGAPQLIARLQARPVTPVTPPATPGVTAESRASRGGYPGYTSYLTKQSNPGDIPQTTMEPGGVARDLHFREKPGNRGNPQPVQATALESIEQGHIVHTAATASPEWVEARDAFHNHLFGCRGCHAPTGRYCQVGAELRTSYDATPWHSTQATRER